MATKSVSIRLSLQDGETVRRALLQLGEDGQKALARIEGAAQPASKALLALNAASQDIQGGMAAFASRLGPIGSVMMALGPAGLAAGAAIGLFSKAMVESTIKVESLEARLKGLVGAAALTETTTYLYAQAQKTGTALETVIGAYARLGALQKAGIITTGESRALLEGFQSTAIALGASSEQLEQSLFGLAQGLSSGTLRAEELNQVVEPMPGLLQALDRAANLPSGGFRQMVTQGKVTADFFRDTLIKALRGFDEAAKESADTAERSFVRMANAWQGFTNAPWLRGILSGGANAGASALESLTPQQSTVKSRLADVDRRIAELGGEQALDKPLPAGTHSVVVQAVQRENEELRRLLAERKVIADDLDEITRKRAGMEAQAKMQRDQIRSEQREPTYVEKLSDLKFEVEWQEKLNAARAAGNAEFTRTKAQYEAAKGFKQLEKELFQQGGVYRTPAKEQEIKGLLAREAETKGSGEMSAQAQAEVLGLDIQARGQEHLAQAAREGGRAQIDAARAVKVLEFAFKNGGMAVGAYDAALRRIDEAKLLEQKNGLIRSLEQETAVNDRLALAAQGSVADTLLAERTNWLAEQAAKGLTDANGELAASYAQVQKSRSNSDAARAIADLEREIDVQVRLAEAVRSGDRSRVRDVTIDNDVAKFARSRKLAEDDPKVDEYRAARSRQYAEAVKDEAQQTNLAYDATLRFKDELAKLNEQRASGVLTEEAYARRYKELEQDKLAASRDWQDGAIRAVRAYVDEATNAAASAEKAMSGALRASEDSFVKWAMTGKLAGRDLFNSLAEEALRAAWRMAVVAPLFGGVGGGLFGGMIASVGSFFSGTGAAGASTGGGSVPVPDTGNFAIAHTGGLIGLDRLQTRTYSASVFAGAPKYHTGGLVAGERPIIAKVGEGVFTPRQMDNADRLLGAALSRPAAAPNVQVTVHNNASNTEAKAQWSQGADGGVQIDIFVEEIEGRMNRRLSRGEGIAPVLEHRYGLNPAAGAYR
jgi:lambda family phage tail tape measure protein